MSTTLSPSTKADLIWKACAACFVPALIWINSLSNDLAVLKARLEAAENSLDSAAAEIKSLNKTTTANAATLASISKTLERIDKRIEDTRADIRVLNTRLLSGGVK